VGKPGEDRALSFEPVFSAAASKSKVQELDCDLAFKSPIASFCEPYRPHTATADQRNKLVRADDLANESAVKHALRCLLQETVLFLGIVFNK
jgi:hypothetical protein